MQNWKWDWQHIVILAAFLVGAVWAGFTYFAAAGGGSASTAVPFALLVVSAGFGFWKTPPTTLAAALQAGENLANAMGKARGFAVSMLVAGVALVGLVLGAIASAPRLLRMLLLVLGLAWLTGCLSSAPIVPETSANAAQIQSCQNTATLHNDVVIGDFVLGGGTAALAGVAAAVPDQGTKTAMGVAGAVTGGIAVAGTAVAELTASNFANSQCSTVVGNLPTAKAPPKSSSASTRPRAAFDSMWLRVAPAKGE